MALYDTADLVSRFHKVIRRPAGTPGITPTDVYRYLTDAHLYWLGQFQVHFPRLNATRWEKMNAAADNKSYSLSSEPLGPVEIYPSPRAPYPLASTTPSGGGDFFWEGADTIVIPGDRPQVFADGPWARYLPRPDDLAEGVQPVMQPEEARVLLPLQAAADWAREGGLEDPATYEDKIDEIWLGKRPGDVGLLGRMKKKYMTSHGSHRPWYKSPDLSNLPVST